MREVVIDMDDIRPGESWKGRGRLRAALWEGASASAKDVFMRRADVQGMASPGYELSEFHIAEAERLGIDFAKELLAAVAEQHRALSMAAVEAFDQRVLDRVEEQTLVVQGRDVAGDRIEVTVGEWTEWVLSREGETVDA